MEQEKLLGAIGVIAALAGLLIVPPLLQALYGFDAVKTAFLVIILYAVLNFVMKYR